LPASGKAGIRFPVIERAGLESGQNLTQPAQFALKNIVAVE
jgi:hypothetical protein